MGRKLQTIYEYLSEYTEEEIDAAIANLSIADKLIIRQRYGNDLHNPLSSEVWTKALSSKFYGNVIPKLKKVLSQNKENVATENTSQIASLDSIVSSNDMLFALIYLLQKSANTEEICNTLNIDNKTLYQLLLELKNKGVKFTRKYSVDGTIQYNKNGKIKSLNKIESNKTIWVPRSLNTVKALVISDLHFGNQGERLDLIDRAYNYCIKNNIHLIFCGGDMIDGTFSKGVQKINNIYEQAEYFINNYPYDKNILTFAVGGDHDFSALSKYNIDIIEMCDNYRHDIVFGNFNNAIIGIQNDKIQLYHFIKGGTMLKTDAPLVLYGHIHKFKLKMRQNRLDVIIPSLSDITETFPSALEMTLKFNGHLIDTTDIKHLYFGSKDMVLLESHFILPKTRKTIKESNIIEDTPSTNAQVKQLSKTMM